MNAIHPVSEQTEKPNVDAPPTSNFEDSSKDCERIQILCMYYVFHFQKPSHNKVHMVQ